MINLTRQVSINFLIHFFFSGSHAKNVRNQLNFETLQFGLKDKTVRCTTFFSLAVHMRWASLVSEMSLEKSDIATVVKRASHTCRYFQVRYNQRIWMFGNVFDRNIGWNSTHLSCFSGFFQPVKNCFAAWFHLYLAYQENLPYETKKNFYPAIWARSPTTYRSSTSHMNSLLIWKFILFRLFVLFTCFLFYVLLFTFNYLFYFLCDSSTL